MLSGDAVITISRSTDSAIIREDLSLANKCKLEGWKTALTDIIDDICGFFSKLQLETRSFYVWYEAVLSADYMSSNRETM